MNRKILYCAILLFVFWHCSKNIKKDFIYKKYDFIKYYEYNLNMSKIFHLHETYNRYKAFNEYEIQDLDNFKEVYLKVFISKGNIIQINYYKDKYLYDFYGTSIIRVYYNDKNLPNLVKYFNKENKLREKRNGLGNCCFINIFIKDKKIHDEFSKVLNFAIEKYIYDDNGKVVKFELYDRDNKLLFTDKALPEE